MRRSRQQRVEDARQVTEILGGLGDAVGAGKTSPPSPYPQPGTRQTESLTGVELRSEQGWMLPRPIQHLCFPPQEYPDNCGPGSTWQCRCAARWVAHGIMVHSYPVGPSRNDKIMGPEYWTWVHDTGTDKKVRYMIQQAMWDWRPTADAILGFLREQR